MPLLRSVVCSLRFRLVVLLLVVLLPALGLNVYAAVQQRRWAAAQAEERALQLARFVAEEQAHIAESVHELLRALSMLPAIRRADPQACPVALADLLRQNARFTSLSVIAPDGHLVCRGLRPGTPTHVRGLAVESAFRRALESRAFAVGEYALGTITGKPVVPYAYPVIDAATGEVEAVITATLDLVWLSRLAARDSLPRGSVVLLLDRLGTILAHYPDPEHWVGRRLASQARLRAALSAGDGPGTLEASGLDGVARLFAYQRLAASETAPAHVLVGMARAEVYGAANRLLARNLAFLIVLGTAAVVAGWWLGTRLVLRPVHALLGATRRLSAGDLQARAHVAADEGELAGLALAFNEMASSLEQRTAERERAFAALRHSERRYRSLVEATAAIVWTAPASGTMEHEQPGWSAFTGQSFEEYRGMGWLEAVHPDDREPTLRAWREALAKPAVHQLEHRLRRADGEYRHMLARAVPIFCDRGEVREWVGIHTDITSRKRAEAERAALLAREQEARAEAERASRAKSDFLAVVSHELRTPLTSIISYAELLESNAEGTLSERHREFVERIAASAWHLTALVDQILEFTRLEAGQVHVCRAAVDLEALVREAGEQMAPLAAAKSLALHVHTPGTPVVVHTDGLKVRQIVLNLLSNAIKFTERGEVRLELAARPGCAVLRVRDTGPGIAAEHHERVWETFWQVENPLTRRAGGAGLGLTIVRRLTRLLGGNVTLESSPGQGSTFTVVLPRQASSPGRVPAVDEAAPSGAVADLPAASRPS